MKITHEISAALVLGSFVFTSAAGGAGEVKSPGVGSVQLIEFPGDSLTIGNLYFSGNGELQLLNLWLENGLIYRYIDGEWVLIHEDMRSAAPLAWPTSVSDDGSIFGLSNNLEFELVEGLSRISLPDRWTVSEEINGQVIDYPAFGRVESGYISGDGQYAALSGREGGRSYTDSLLWDGGDELINLSFGLPRDRVSYKVGIPSRDASVVAFGANYFAPINNVRSVSTDRDVWVWKDGVASMVPHLDPGYGVAMRLSDVSGNGEAVIGDAEGLWQEGFNTVIYEPGSDGPSLLEHGPGLAWIWTEAEGTRQIADPRFAEVTLSSIDEDASIVLGGGIRHNGAFQRFLWMRDGELILLDDLLYTLGIMVNADWYSLNELSNDGTKLMGYATVDGHYHALIVTIPDLTP